MDDLHVEYESTPAAWCAYYDPEGYIGRGKTQHESVVELLEHVYEAWGTAIDERNAAKRLYESTLTAQMVAERSLSDSTTRIAALTSALSFAEGAIEDAIYTETGIDGDTGQRVLHIIREAMASGTFDQTSPPVEEPPTRRELVHYAEKIVALIDEEAATWEKLWRQARERLATNTAEYEVPMHAMNSLRRRVAALSKNTVNEVGRAATPSSEANKGGPGAAVKSGDDVTAPVEPLKDSSEGNASAPHPEQYDAPDFDRTLEQLADWLDKKYGRHGEWCDKLAADAIRAFRAAADAVFKVEDEPISFGIMHDAIVPYTRWRRATAEETAAVEASLGRPVKAVLGVFTDSQRMDWLETRRVIVNSPMRYGSASVFSAQATQHDAEADVDSPLRAFIDQELRAAKAVPSQVNSRGMASCSCPPEGCHPSNMIGKVCRRRGGVNVEGSQS